MNTPEMTISSLQAGWRIYASTEAGSYRGRKTVDLPYRERVADLHWLSIKPHSDQFYSPMRLSTFYVAVLASLKRGELAAAADLLSVIRASYNRDLRLSSYELIAGRKGRPVFTSFDALFQRLERLELSAELMRRTGVTNSSLNSNSSRLNSNKMDASQRPERLELSEQLALHWKRGIEAHEAELKLLAGVEAKLPRISVEARALATELSDELRAL